MFTYDKHLTRLKGAEMSNEIDGQPVRIGVVTVSDRAFGKIYEDRSGPGAEGCLREFLKTEFDYLYRLVPDDWAEISASLCELADIERCCLIVTTGGTGPATRDLTVDVTEAVCDKMMPGFGELMRQVSLLKVPTAILSRQEAGIRNRTLIINLPGSPKAIRECLLAVFPAVPYCIDLLDGPFLETDERVVTAFRPKK